MALLPSCLLLLSVGTVAEDWVMDVDGWVKADVADPVSRGNAVVVGVFKVRLLRGDAATSTDIGSSLSPSAGGTCYRYTNGTRYSAIFCNPLIPWAYLFIDFCIGRIMGLIACEGRFWMLMHRCGIIMMTCRRVLLALPLPVCSRDPGIRHIAYVRMQCTTSYPAGATAFLAMRMTVAVRVVARMLHRE